MTKSLLTPEPKWREEADGCIHLSLTVTSEGPGLVERLEASGCYIQREARELLRDFCMADGTHEVVVVPCRELYPLDRKPESVRTEASRLGYRPPPVEVALLIASFTDAEVRDMESRVIIFHEPIVGSDGRPRLLAMCSHFGQRWLRCFYSAIADEWWAKDRYVFLAP